MAYDSENYVVTDLPQPPTLSPEVRETLVKAKKLIKKGWCKHQRHRESSGLFFGTKHEYCIIGAVEAACGLYSHTTIFEAAPYADAGSYYAATDALRAQLTKVLGHRNLPEFNDTTSQADVLKLFDDTLREQA